MDKAVKKLKTLFYAPILLGLVLVVAFEMEWLRPGFMCHDGSGQFMWLTIMELYTVCTIPLSLYLFNIPAVKKQLLATPVKSIVCYGGLRLLILGVGLVANVLFYYWTMNVSFGYMAIIFLLVLPFVYPSRRRCESETTKEQ